MFFLFLQLHSFSFLFLQFYRSFIIAIFYFDEIKKSYFHNVAMDREYQISFYLFSFEESTFREFTINTTMCKQNSYYDVNCIYFEIFVGICCNVYTTYFVSSLLTISLAACKNFVKLIKTVEKKFIN